MNTYQVTNCGGVSKANIQVTDYENVGLREQNTKLTAHSNVKTQEDFTAYPTSQRLLLQKKQQNTNNLELFPAKQRLNDGHFLRTKVQTILKGEASGRNKECYDDAVRRKECTADRNEENIGGKAGRVANDSYGCSAQN